MKTVRAILKVHATKMNGKKYGTIRLQRKELTEMYGEKVKVTVESIEEEDEKASAE